ncbi:hypothetical protein [Shimia sagamensis]|uniref:Uncharacterized protein n=1 Tax=Shimia sagamensis TaxID=1566352 RepID=A0ABY1PDD8_9RHOB|nr:hypothetical protein [Shimia sagamensis]SMP32001.1 hypothetical protein SAMN06265373_108113 [Shimia sagamensis]
MTRTPFDHLPAATQAGILCSDKRFHRFVEVQLKLQSGWITETGAAEYLRQTCEVQSRRELTTNPTAVAKFQTLRTEFDAHIGKISRPR